MKYYELSPMDLERMGAELGRDISTDLGRLADYSDIDLQLLSELKTLAQEGITRDPIRYLLFLLAGKGGAMNAESYVNRVVLGPIDPLDWIANLYRP